MHGADSDYDDYTPAPLMASGSKATLYDIEERRTALSDSGFEGSDDLTLVDIAYGSTGYEPHHREDRAMLTLELKDIQLGAGERLCRSCNTVLACREADMGDMCADCAENEV